MAEVFVLLRLFGSWLEPNSDAAKCGFVSQAFQIYLVVPRYLQGLREVQRVLIPVPESKQARSTVVTLFGIRFDLITHQMGALGDAFVVDPIWFSRLPLLAVQKTNAKGCASVFDRQHNGERISKKAEPTQRSNSSSDPLGRACYHSSRQQAMNSLSVGAFAAYDAFQPTFARSSLHTLFRYAGLPMRRRTKYSLIGRLS